MYTHTHYSHTNTHTHVRSASDGYYGNGGPVAVAAAY